MLTTVLLTFSSFITGFNSSDSIRTEVIDGKTFIIHRVEQRETLFGISRRYGVALLGVVESNPEASSGLEVGQLVKIPYVPNKKSRTSEGTIHKVGQKETLYSISKQYGVSIDELKEWNSLSGSGLNLGQELLIKDKIPDTNEVNRHIVAAGETMYSISRKYGISTGQIKEWNSLSSDDLSPGQVILISGMDQKAISSNNNVSNSFELKPVEEKVPQNETKNTISIPVTQTSTGSDEVHETGMVLLLDGTEGNRKYLAHHRSVKPGTILRVKNNASRREVFVRVIGNLPSTEASDVILRISKSALDKLDGEGKFPVEVTYFK